MENRKLIVTTDKKSIMMENLPTYGVSLVLALLVALFLQAYISPYVPLLIAVVLCLGFFSSVSGAQSQFTFMAADEYKGPRLMVKTKKDEYEVYDTRAEHYVIKQNSYGKKHNTGSIKIVNTNMTLHGVTRIDEVQAFIKKHFR